MRPAPTFLLVCAVLACVVLAAMVTAPQAQARNPFVKGQGEEAANATASPQGPAMPAVLAPYLSPILREIATAQQALKNRLASFGQAMRASPHGGAFWLFLGAAFLYGVVHAAGPGHGKAFACAYFASRPAGLRDAGLFSAIAMATHVFTAAGLVLGGAFVMRMSGVLAVERYGDWLITASYGLLALVGLAFSFDAVRELRRHWNPALECPANEGAGRRGLVATATAVGLAPCPGAAIVLVYALTQGLLLQGMAAMVAIAVGMSVTTTLVAYTVLLARRGLASAVRGRQTLLSRVHGLLTLFGSLALLCAGLLLLIGRLVA